ncbi:MAG: LAGLIDADG family homing endonuclease, partial [Candidatus Bathyarchaeia archaeon]
MLNEFKDLIDPKRLPARRKYLYYYIVGLVDGEGCFSISIKRQDDTRFGWVIDPVFHVTQSKDQV